MQKGMDRLASLSKRKKLCKGFQILKLKEQLISQCIHLITNHTKVVKL